MSILDKSYIGKGKFFLRNRAGVTGLEAAGNVTALSLTHEESEISINDFTRPGGAKRNSVQRVDSVGINLSVTDFNGKNLEKVLRGAVTTVTTQVVVDESLTVPTTLETDTLLKTANVIDTTVAPVLTSDPAGTTYVEGNDYEVTGAGIVILPGGSIAASAALLVDYTSKTVEKVEAVIGSAPEFEVCFAGVNEAQSDVPLIVTGYRAKFTLPTDVGLIADEFGVLELEGELLADASIAATNESQYYKVEVG